MEQAGSPRTPWSRLNNLRVGTKIVVAVAVVAIVAVVTAGVAWSRMGSLDSGVQRLQAGNITRLDSLVVLQNGMADMYRGLFLHQGAQSEAEKTNFEKEVKDAQQAVDTASAQYASVPEDSATWSTQVKAFDGAWKQYRALVNLLLFRDPVPAGVELPTALPDQYALWGEAENTMNTAVDELMTLERAQTAQAGTDAHQQVSNARTLIIVLVTVGVLLSIALALVIGRSVSRRLASVRTVLDAVADGDLTQTARATGADEVGQMAQAVNRATDSIRVTVSALADSSRMLADSSHQFSASAEAIAGTANDTSNQTTLLASASEDVSHSVQAVAAGAEEMGSAIREISQSASDAAGVASQAVTAAATAQTTVSKLGDSSAEIGNVVKVITSIAEQTNLLALNATIEAARAGETGKGFAVVAGEVKELAQETAKATEDISRRVEAIQADTNNAVAAITEISTIISQINDYQMTIASAVEEQTATTAEMSRSIIEASQGSSSITDNIASVAAAAKTTTVTVGQTQQSAQELARMSSDLQSVVARFRV
ncbi:methyl-accepting chemotaxis protein [Actinoplanes sp. GCM10030250]|uniref:methyl-accepting chemotaxis protein n=1 Tax=Actinoplanes sp. GCM10030250 TaxID=3273376 RepID=UPI003618E57A